MRIGLIVDHPKRDLEGIVRIAYELARRGADAFVVPMYSQGVDVPRLGLDGILLNFARPANRALIERYAKAGLKVFVLDTEGGVLVERGAGSPQALARRVRDEGYGPFLSGYFFWGETVKEAFAAEGALPPERLHVTGCPRFDFTATPWRSMLDREKRDYVLVNANFPTVNPRFADSASRERKNMLDLGWDAPYMDRLFAELQVIFERYLQTVREIARARPQIEFVVRPHPFERTEPYLETFRGLRNVAVSGAGSALHAIHNSRAILHLNCGTAIEAVMLEKLPIQMEFLNAPAAAEHTKLPAKVSLRAVSMDALLSALDDIEGAVAKFPFRALYREHIFPFFYENDGQAGNRVAATLVRELERTGATRRWHSVTASLASGRPNPSPGQLANGVASLLLGSATAAAVRSWLEPRRREKLFTARQVQDILAQLAARDASGGAGVGVRQDRGGPLKRPLASLHVVTA